MPLKNVNNYQLISGAAMDGTTVFTSSASNIIYHDSVAVSFNWTGNPVGSFAIQGSNDYNPGLPQTGQLNAGTWNSLTLTPTPSAGSGSSTYLINMNQLGFAWLRAVYTNSTGTGILSGYICAKSLG